MQPLLTPGQVAEMLSISERKAYALKDLIGYIALGGNIRFEADAVQAYIGQCKRGPAERGERQWESRSDTAPPGDDGSSRKRVSAGDISARLQQRGMRKSTPPSAAQN